MKKCDRVAKCARPKGHKGCCTAFPADTTLKWDQLNRTMSDEDIQAAVTLVLLDFPSPPWADLLDGD